MSKTYKGDYGQDLRVKVGMDLSTALTTKILVKKPNGLQTEWIATVVSPASEGVLSYTILSTDFNQAGQYSFQSYVTFATSAFKGETTKLKVWDKFE